MPIKILTFDQWLKANAEELYIATTIAGDDKAPDFDEDSYAKAEYESYRLKMQGK